MSEVATSPAEADMLELDPFSYHPLEASVISGLGGTGRPSSPGYALHTDYVHVAEGPANFILRFRNLSAKLGTLQLRVHMLVEGPPVRLLLANTVRIQLNRLIQLGGEIAVPFAGIKGVQFAIHGAVLGETDATASGLAILLDRPASDDDRAMPVADLRNTEYGQAATRPVPMLMALETATLAAPVGQMATVAQTREAPFAEWSTRLRLQDDTLRSRWSASYILQVIRTYGFMQEGARALGFGAGAAEIGDVLRSLGMLVDVDMLPPLPQHVPGRFIERDVVWSVDEIAHSGIADAFEYVTALMTCLRPSGIAIHVVPFVPGRGQRTLGEAGLAFRRGDIERLAVTMIARDGETSQLKLTDEGPVLGSSSIGLSDIGAFGLVFRKAPLKGS